MRVNRTDMHLALDRQKAGLLGVSSIEVDRTVRLAIAGLTAGELRTPDGDDHDVVVRLPRAGRPTPEPVIRRIDVQVFLGDASEPSATLSGFSASVLLP
jgi:multidrug efflux pump subunit AcrB